MDEPVQLYSEDAENSSLVPLCIPWEKKIEIGRNDPLVATGWGKTSNKGSFAEILQKLEMPIFPIDECIRLSEFAEYGVQLTDGKQICAGRIKGN